METKKIQSFTDLNTWKESHKLVLEVYKMTKKFPKEETYSLSDQLRRASVSITSNIAEGFGRQTNQEKTQFYYMSSGSISEVKNQLLIAKDLKYIDKKDFVKVAEMANVSHKLLNGLIRANKSNSKNQKSNI